MNSSYPCGSPPFSGSQSSPPFSRAIKPSRLVATNTDAFIYLGVLSCFDQLSAKSWRLPPSACLSTESQRAGAVPSNLSGFRNEGAGWTQKVPPWIARLAFALRQSASLGSALGPATQLLSADNRVLTTAALTTRRSVA